MERAIALDPNSRLLAMQVWLRCWAVMGRPEEALQMVEQALRRKPGVVDEHLG